MPLGPAHLLRAYAQGIFPMAEARDDPNLFWVDPRRRGIVPLDNLHLSRSLRRRLRRGSFTATLNGDFAGTLAGCADRDETWINAPLADLYLALARDGHAHSVEIWQDGALAGGIFGIAQGGAFFGESMFSRRTDASKAALVWLVDLLCRSGFALFDTQFLTPHLASLGAVEIPRAEYRRRLSRALALPVSILPGPLPPACQVVQRMTQMS
nr:leucyl/phenylalanyl-tRNA--protein transferase [Oceaniovalibus guishaninsula]